MSSLIYSFGEVVFHFRGEGGEHVRQRPSGFLLKKKKRPSGFEMWIESLRELKSTIHPQINSVRISGGETQERRSSVSCGEKKLGRRR